MHPKKPPFICETCGKGFRDEEKFKQHVQNNCQNLKRGNYPFRCPECSRAFKSDEALGAHIILVHSNTKPFKCPVCGEEFRSLRDFTKHKERHENPSFQFTCQYCEEKFSFKKDLTLHVREKHPKPHVCDVCGAAFARKGNLSQHMLTHGQAKEARRTFVCPVEGCGSAFTRLSNLRTHKKSIHGGLLPCVCPTCGKDYLYPSLLEIHQRKHQPREEIPEINLDDIL